jgi:Protein of unknown function (DUF3489)
MSALLQSERASIKRTTRRQPWPIEVVKLISRKQGASIAELMKARGWQAHSVRAAISTLRKQSELQVESTGTRGVAACTAPSLLVGRRPMSEQISLWRCAPSGRRCPNAGRCDPVRSAEPAPGRPRTPGSGRRCPATLRGPCSAGASPLGCPSHRLKAKHEGAH